MKKNLYRVEFKNGEARNVWAFNPSEASILAKAQQIEEGLDYAVVDVRLED